MKTKYLWRVWNVDTGEAYECFANNNLEAICACGGADSDAFVGPFRAQEMLTPEGYRITCVRMVPQGTRFNLVARRGKDPTHPRVFTRGEYDRPWHQYLCSYVDEFRRCRGLNGNTLITTDALERKTHDED